MTLHLSQVQLLMGRAAFNLLEGSSLPKSRLLSRSTCLSLSRCLLSTTSDGDSNENPERQRIPRAGEFLKKINYY